MFHKTETEPKVRPCREHNLLVSTSKHLYLNKSGHLRHQQKELDPRSPGSKTLLTRLAVHDVDIGAMYGEFHRADIPLDLLGFLARAWSMKADHPMHGIPEQLNVPKGVTGDADMNLALILLANAAHFRVSPLPAGFAAGVNSMKHFEGKVESLLWQIGGDISLEPILAASAKISRSASSGMSLLIENIWNAVPAPSKELLAMVDAQYDPVGGWRLGPFEWVLKGVPQSK